jgi:hypothetical protein
MDVLYSAWARWRISPEKYQYEWFTAYSNLLKFKHLMRDKLVIVKYEDMVTDISSLQKVFDFIGVQEIHDPGGFLHGRSIQKWRNDRLYGFELSEKVRELAEHFGYPEKNMANERNPIWPLYQRVLRALHRGLMPAIYSVESLRSKQVR